MKSLAACLFLAAVVAAALARPAEQGIELQSLQDVMPTTNLLAQDLDLLAQMGQQPVVKYNPQDRPTRASPLAHIIADIIDIKYQLGRAFLSRFFTLSAY
ncbi:Hypothetical predicted protein [Cloeon dipterum]|uniref:Uncharacterized protein n=1 Tax=Cloeon dipterum TaxID=197152 RepID=A0A8S1E4D2_9INSE|nr:Hypothetical predicted protein [Cloeon dipterum]